MLGSPLSAAYRMLGPVALWALLATVVSCKHKSAPVQPIAIENDDGTPAQEPSAKSRAKPPAEPARCRELRAGALFSIGESEPARDSAPQVDGNDEDEDEPIAMPFEV